MNISEFIAPNPLALFGLIVIGGVIGGQAAHIIRFLPRISGYIFIGFLLGPHITNLVSESDLSQTKILIDLAIGLVLYQLGLTVDLRQLVRNRNLMLTGILESLATFVLLTWLLLLLHIDFLQAALVAAIGVSSSPAVTLLIINEIGADGPVSHKSLVLTAINNIFSFCLYTALLPLLHMSVGNTDANLYTLAVYPAYRLIGSLVLAYFLAKLMIQIGRFIGQQENVQFALMVGMLILSVGVAKMVYVSPMMTLLLLGIMVVNLDKNQVLMEVEMGHSGEIFFLILFVVTGAKLHINHLFDVGLIAVFFVVIRAAAKMIPVYFMSRRQGMNKTQSISLGTALLPMASMAIGLINTTLDTSFDFANKLATIILAAVAILEIIGPILAVLALKESGELDPDQEVAH